MKEYFKIQKDVPISKWGETEAGKRRSKIDRLVSGMQVGDSVDVPTVSNRVSIASKGKKLGYTMVTRAIMEDDGILFYRIWRTK